ncbi:hypothetical protein [Halanaeroarchaeum sulfurireducens]|uniref:Uncharacterized protein n=1 Tax=Halanaeroarchaeum sulfurireducens TaxID=1604004 RepID=A0A0F7P8S3_9EURY|nr:hypothetical protein [Halanaeroarchaeum sulfurireducens]AKH97571.1 hypothetical protein HLASF_1083 [Halanaeroarchaeum sulfurireducens]ALG81967.1 hypothetical protein HLASA_1072 [Halanaeroarchaeum sulfurireducens]
MIEYYDLVLGLIPLALFGVGGGLHVVGIALNSAIIVGSLIAAGLIAHAMFVRGPVPFGGPNRAHVSRSRTDSTTTPTE